MKNLFLLAASAVLLVGCDSSKSNKESRSAPHEGAKAIAADTVKAVSLAAEPATLKLAALPDSITVTMTNSTADTVTTGTQYRIEKWGSSGWEEVSPKDVAFQDIGWRLKPGASRVFAKKLYKERAGFTAGSYRIVKHYLKSDYLQTRERFNVYAAFAIAE